MLGKRIILSFFIYNQVISMNNQSKVTGVILAGGLARRMNNQDKGLVNYKGRPLVSYAIAALTAVADRSLINANRNRERYQMFGLPVNCRSNRQF